MPSRSVVDRRGRGRLGHCRVVYEPLVVEFVILIRHTYSNDHDVTIHLKQQNPPRLIRFTRCRCVAS